MTVVQMVQAFIVVPEQPEVRQTQKLQELLERFKANTAACTAEVNGLSEKVADNVSAHRGVEEALEQLK